MTFCRMSRAVAVSAVHRKEWTSTGGGHGTGKGQWGARCAAGGVKGKTNAHHDPDSTALQRIMGDPQRDQMPRGGQSRLEALRR